MAEVKSYKVIALPQRPTPDSIYWVKASVASEVEGYITDRQGVPYPLKDLQGSGGITTLINTDGNLVITGVNNKVINITPALLSLVNSALQSGASISELVNDTGYITSVDLPTKTSELINDGSDATSTYVEVDELGTTAFSNDYNDLDNKPTIPTVITNHSGLSLDDGTNPHGTTKSDVGLGNANNTSDADKPVSNATQSALNGKANTVHSHVISDVNGLQNELNAKLSNDPTTYTAATLPLAGTELALVEQGGTFKKVAVSEFGGEEIYTEVTKTELDALITNSELIPNALYKITGCEAWMVIGDATESLYLKAISNNELSKSGMGRFYTPKYATDEIWKGEIYQAFPADFPIAPSYNIGDKVIWGGRLWINTNGNLGTKINHFTLSADWEIVIFDSVSYDLSTDIIEYDYENDYVFFRKDNKGSEVSSSIVAWTSIEDDFNSDPLSDSIYNPLKVYQWGNENCYGNIVYVGSILECVNSDGQIYNNTLSSSNIESNTLSSSSGIYNNTLSNSYIFNNTLSSSNIESNTLSSNVAIFNNTLSNGAIFTNTLSNGTIFTNTLSSSNIENNTLSNGTITLSNPITQSIINLSINADIIGDFSTATLIYATYSRDVFSNSNGVTKIKYFNENDVLIVADITE